MYNLGWVSNLKITLCYRAILLKYRKEVIAVLIILSQLSYLFIFIIII